MTEQQHIEAIQKAYANDVCYYDGYINGEPFKIRMNKDHKRNASRNDDQGMHNLSLINIKDETARVYRQSGKYLQWQIDNIVDWQDAQEQIEEFFYQITK